MATTIHLPAGLLERVDRRAESLGLSRSGYIARILQQACQAESGWSPGFIDSLRDAGSDPEAREAVDRMMAEIRARRRSKKAPRL